MSLLNFPELSYKAIECLVKKTIEVKCFLDAPVLIFGAGDKGTETCRELKKRGVNVTAILDNYPKEKLEIEGVSIMTPTTWLSQYPNEYPPIIIAIHNENVFLPKLISGLREMGFGEIITLMALYDVFPDLPMHYWLINRGEYLTHVEKIYEFQSLFLDSLSKKWVQSVLMFRLRGEYECLPLPEKGEQYHPEGLFDKSIALRMVDCGAFVGDTILDFYNSGYNVESVIAFEPDVTNYQKISANIASIDTGVTCIPCGVADETKYVRFTAEKGGASHIDQVGGDLILCSSLDEVLVNFQPNFIKMDIEGAEVLALSGALNTIKKYRPILAISVYHHFSHLWDIPLKIASLSLGYRFYLRGHRHSSFDLVLYAIPE